MADPTVDRITELEVALAFQEKLIADLDSFVRGFASRLERAEQKIAELTQCVLSDELPVGPADDPPPHY